MTSAPPPAPPSLPALPDVCTPGHGEWHANFWENMGVAALNIFGLGGIVKKAGAQTPYDKMKAALAEQNQKAQQAALNFELTFARLEEDINEATFNTISSQYKTIQAEIKYEAEILQEQIDLNTIYVAAVFVIVLVLITFLISN